ncbi:MAG: hypothetical protein HYT79_04490 [Elusimicrobia bacterium]|nr:hypothetical protein [Elusimicrobiota bacterium]
MKSTIYAMALWSLLTGGMINAQEGQSRPRGGRTPEKMGRKQGMPKQEMTPEKRLEMLKERLELSDQQLGQIKPVLDEEKKVAEPVETKLKKLQEEMKRISFEMNEVRHEREILQNQTNETIRSMLTPEQKMRFDQMRRGPMGHGQGRQMGGPGGQMGGPHGPQGQYQKRGPGKQPPMMEGGPMMNESFGEQGPPPPMDMNMPPQDFQGQDYP